MEVLEEKIHSQFEDMENALHRLEEALEEEKSDFLRDSVIQRFEFCSEI